MAFAASILGLLDPFKVDPEFDLMPTGGVTTCDAA
jgi:hypothetical protein